MKQTRGKTKGKNDLEKKKFDFWVVSTDDRTQEKFNFN